MAQRKVRIDELLVGKGLAPDLRTAQAWVMDRRIVSAGRVIDKPGERVSEAALISVRGMVLRYASKGGYKLESALSTFAIDDLIVADVDPRIASAGIVGGCPSVFSPAQLKPSTPRSMPIPSLHIDQNCTAHSYN